ncbi:MAG TPA: hypothetical protein VMJ75_18180 [Candidatus Acidoferrales bacterium]|nr:hypothetical protein [Candidatus Acidoferrales bacterium]
MSSPATGLLANDISIDLLNDLKDGSHLKALLAQSQTALLAISSAIAQYSDQPVRTAVGSPSAMVTISAPASWKTTTGIVFSLTPQASCLVAISNTSSKFAVSKSIDSSDTEDVVLGPSQGKVYVNIDLDFSICASVSGSGTVSGIGISGKASGAATATLSYCHAVDATTNTVDALVDAFSTLVFPFEPDCALRMGAGDQGRVNFDGSLGFGLDVTYGLGSYQFSAPGIDSVRQSIQKGFDNLTFPTVTVDAGAKASFAYTHADHFGAIVQKTDPLSARLYLVRSAANETDGSAGITVGITVSPLYASPAGRSTVRGHKENSQARNGPFKPERRPFVGDRSSGPGRPLRSKRRPGGLRHGRSETHSCRRARSGSIRVARRAGM